MAPAEREVLPALEELGIGFVPYSPLGRGFLTGTMDRNTTFDSANDHRNNNPRLSAENRNANQPVLDAIAVIGERKKATSAQIAIAWLLARKPWIVPIPGTTRMSRMEDNLRAADITFSAAELAEIDRVFAGIEIHGDRYTAAQAARVQR